jgi:hypothetical protein
VKAASANNLFTTGSAKARFEAVQETAGVYSIVKDTNCKFFDETERLKNPDPTPPVKS